MKAHVAFRLQRSDNVEDIQRDGATRDLQWKQIKVSAVMVLTEHGMRMDMIPLNPETGYRMHTAMHTVMPAWVRTTHARPKNVCEEHGCTGCQSSILGNFALHQQEKSGPAVKVTCSGCGASFQCSSSRDDHILHQECKAVMEPSLASHARMEADRDRLPLSDKTTMSDKLSIGEEYRLLVLRAWLQTTAWSRNFSPEHKTVPIEEAAEDSNQQLVHEL